MLIVALDPVVVKAKARISLTRSTSFVGHGSSPPHVLRVAGHLPT